MTPDFLVVFGAITVAYFVKGVTGVGGPLLAIPVVASVTGIEHAVVVLSFANLVSNGWLLWEHRAGAAGTGFIMIPFLTAGTVATVAGTWLLTEIDDRFLSVLVAVIIVGYIISYVNDPELRLDRRQARRWAAPIGLVGGALVGATGVGGPLIATYLHSIRFSRSAFISALNLTFQVLGAIQIVALLWLGAFTQQRTVEAVWMILPVVAMTPLGIVVGRRLSQRWFEVLVLALLASAAVRLVVTAF